jgi:putative acetyltransferase
MSGVIELIAGVYREYGFIFAAEEEVPSLLAFDRHYAAPDAEFFVLRHSGKVVGSIGVVRAAPGQAELRHFYVLAKLRGQGLGRALIGRALRWYRDRAVADVFLWSDTRFDRAHRLYERMGFVRTGERVQQDVKQQPRIPLRDETLTPGGK